MLSLPAVLIVAGVSGAGKTTIGRLLAQRLNYAFRDADDFHPPENIAKMSRGEPLTDDDRVPWLDAIAAWIGDTLAADGRAVVTCSALKRSYRDRLVGQRRSVRLVFLNGDMALIARRLAARRGHFMPAQLLQSQFDALEQPQPAENLLIVSIAATPEAIVAEIVSRLSNGE
jgi:gluconokinase